MMRMLLKKIVLGDERKWSDTYENTGSILQAKTNAKIKKTRRYSKNNSLKRNKRNVWTVTTKLLRQLLTFPPDLRTIIKALQVCSECKKPYIKNYNRIDLI